MAELDLGELKRQKLLRATNDSKMCSHDRQPPEVTRHIGEYLIISERFSSIYFLLNIPKFIVFFFFFYEHFSNILTNCLLILKHEDRRKHFKISHGCTCVERMLCTLYNKKIQNNAHNFLRWIKQ